MHLFAYGTLMSEDIFLRVTGCHEGRAVEAFLKNYQRYAVKGESYPGIVQQNKAIVRGKLYFDLPEDSWQRLDEFEGEMYTRRLVQVSCGDDALFDAAAYVVRSESVDLLSGSLWSFKQFLQSGAKV